MAFIIVSFMSCFTTLYSQVLNNTYWEMYTSGGAINFYFQFKTDTVFISFDNITYVEKSTYQENGNAFQIIDLPLTGCPVSDIGDYSFAIHNDTLTFTTISDPCTSREFIFSTNYGLRLMNPVSEASFSQHIQLYALPHDGKQFILRFSSPVPHPTVFSIYTTDGKTAITETPVTYPEQKIDLRNYPPGIYLVSVVSGNRRITRKIQLLGI